MDSQTILILLHYCALGTVLTSASLLAQRRNGIRFAALLFFTNLATISTMVLCFPIVAAYYSSNPSIAGGSEVISA